MLEEADRLRKYADARYKEANVAFRHTWEDMTKKEQREINAAANAIRDECLTST